MALLPQSSEMGHNMSQSAIVSLSIFAVVCVAFLLTFSCTMLRQRQLSALQKRAFRRFSYDTFDSHNAPTILFDEHFIQPQAPGCRSTTLSPIQETHSEGLTIPAIPHRRHSAPKAIQHFVRDKCLLRRPASSCIQFSQPLDMTPILHLSVGYIHTVELLRVIVDRVTGLPSQKGTMIYVLQVRVMPRSRTCAYLSKPLLTPAVREKPEFDHLFEYTVSLQRLDQAKIEATLFARPWSSSLDCSKRRNTVGEISYTRRVSFARSDVKLTELLEHYKEVGKAELKVEARLLRSDPEALTRLTLPLVLADDETDASTEVAAD
ncbi:unnamed protein product [Mesocestoides corti]|uniref:C2 domain-containing protein n=1 Tax=Mesocestoides corti TaxID=53468 RepID=A0A0R3UH19_MESCO|nr:unnamed protein product [Mesocestoides corti]